MYIKIITTAGIMLCIAVSCNPSGKEKNNGKDSTKQSKMVNTPAKDSITEEADFTKRNINLTQVEWLTFKNKFHISASGKTDNSVTGKFKGDGMQQTLYLVAPAEDTINKDAFQECIGGCDSYIVSSDTGMTILKVSSNLGGETRNIGDLDGDGADEIMVYPDWWQSNWNAYMIYSYNSVLHKWSFLIEPVTIFANELEKNIPFVKKSAQKGFVSAYTSVLTEEDIKSSYKNFKIIK